MNNQKIKVQEKHLDKVEKKDSKKLSIEEEIESIKQQYNDAINKQQQYSNLAQRCLGAIEVLEKMIKDSDV